MEKDHTQQTKNIIWPKDKENDNQRLSLQPVSVNEGKKLKSRIEKHYGRKEKSDNVTTIKLFAR